MILESISRLLTLKWGANMIDVASVASDAVSDTKECMAKNLFDYLSKIDPSVLYSDILSAISSVDTSALVNSTSLLLSNKMTGVTDVQNKASQMGAEANYLKKVSKEAKIAAAHNNQDAKKSISFSEPIPAELGKATIKDQTNPDYSYAANYPLSYGHVDEANNWYKVNQETGEIEFVHNSGSFFKIDKSGNGTIHLTGSLKWIIDKDMLMQVVNSTEIVKGDRVMHVFKTNEETVGSTSVQQSSGTQTVKSSSNTIVKGSKVLIN